MSVTDLTGTSWRWLFNTEGKPDFYPATTKSINFTSNGQSFDAMVFYRWSAGDGNSVDYSLNGTLTSVWTVDLNVPDDNYEDENYQEFTVTGGLDATNSDLIALIEANATQVTPTPSNKISVGSLPLSKMFVGNVEVSKAILNSVTLYEKEAPQPTGYDLTINFVARNYEGAGESQLYIRVNDSSDSYRFVTPYAGSYGKFYDPSDVELVDVGYDYGGECTLHNVNKIAYSMMYFTWGDRGDFIGVNSNSVQAPLAPSESEITLTGDTTITVYYDYDE